MGNILVYCEQRQGKIRSIGFEVVSAGRKIADQLGGEVIALTLGSEAPAESGKLGAYGADKVIAGVHTLFSNYTSEAFAAAVTKAARAVNAEIVLLVASSEGRDFAPRVAAKLDCGFVPDVTKLEVENGTLLITRPVYAGKAFTTLKSTTKPQVITIRPKVFSAVESKPGFAAPIESLTDLTITDMKTIFKEFKAAGGGQMDVTEADVIVSGGRGMGNAANFAVLEPLAQLLHGVVGASRAAVDAGWIAHSTQVGQTGKVVNPSLYIACGISGAIQHLAGMSNSKVIVAINKDKEAPIFQVADYGIVGDLFEVVPALVTELKKFID